MSIRCWLGHDLRVFVHHDANDPVGMVREQCRRCDHVRDHYDQELWDLYHARKNAVKEALQEQKLLDDVMEHGT